MNKRLIALSFLFALTPYAASAASLHVTVRPPSVTGSIPQGAQRVEMMNLVFAASCTDDAHIDSITLRDSGLGRSSDISGVYLMNDVRRVSRVRRLSGDDRTVTIPLRGFTVRKCTTETLRVLADFSVDALAGSEHFFTIPGPGAVTSDADVSVQTVSRGVLHTTPSRIGTLTVSYLPLRRPVQFGPGETVARFQLSADNVSDQIVSSIMLTNNGSARDADLQDLELVLSNGKTIAAAESLDGDRLAFRISPPLLLTKGQTRVLTVRANIQASRRRTIRFEVDEPSDIESSARKQRGASYQ